MEKINSGAVDDELISSAENVDSSDAVSDEATIKKSEVNWTKEWLVDSILQMYQVEEERGKLRSYQILRRLLAHLQEINPKAYKKVKYTDLKNPKISNIYSAQGRLPVTFPTDLYYAGQMLSTEDRAFIYEYYREYED